MEQLREDLSVGADAPLRKEQATSWVLGLEELVEMFGASEDGVVLEGIGPPLRVWVVLLKQVVLVNLLPVGHGFGSDSDVGHSFGQQIE
jgi:hypothetical protein